MSAGRVPPSGTVALLFTDIEGSTRLWQADPEAMATALARHDVLLRQEIEHRQGYVFKTVGDAFCAVFPTVPLALAAAQASLLAIAREEWSTSGPLRVRMAVHVGATEERNADYFGPNVNRVARLLSAGHGGQVLLSLAAAELSQDTLPSGVTLRDLGEHRLKDLNRPERIYQLVVPGLPADFPPLITLDNRPNNLPSQLTPFIGRDKDLAEVVELLRRSDVRLLTLSGSGGTGKTRLSLLVAAQLIDEYPNGIWFVPLEETRDEVSIVGALAQALGVRESGENDLKLALMEFLRPKRLLFVLDNFEQVAHAAPLLTQILTTAGEVDALVSSRVRLGVRGEHEYRVPPLGIPPVQDHEIPVDQLVTYDAVRLFVERAQAAKAGFTLTAENAAAVAQICQSLDGLPLAIELAAARVRLLPPAAIVKRLEDRLGLLVGGGKDRPERQQTLRAAIAWSHDLLPIEHRTVFARLSVFAGGWGFEAAEAVANPNGALDLVTSLEALVDHNLVRQEETGEGEPRFTMLATIREFARERLNAFGGGELELARMIHAEYFLDFAERAEPALTGSDQAAWLERLAIEHDNLRAALAWFDQEGETDAELRLSGAIWRFWAVRGFLSEGRHWLDQALTNHRAAVPESAAKVLEGAGCLAEAQGDWEQAVALLDEALALRREIGDHAGIASVLVNLGNVAHYRGEHHRSTDCYQEALEIARGIGDRRTAANALSGLGDDALRRGDYDLAVALLEEGLTNYRTVGDVRGAGANLVSLGMLAIRRGEIAQGAKYYQESLELWQKLGDRLGTLAVLLNLAEVSLRVGDQGRAASLADESLSLAHDLGHNAYEAIALNTLGRGALAQGDPSQAQAHFLASVELGRKVGERETVADGLEQLAIVAAIGGQDEVGVRLFGAAAALRDEIQAPLPDADRQEHDRVTVELRERLGREAFNAAWSAGSSLTIETAVAATKHLT